jgi:hypothetical protein
MSFQKSKKLFLLFFLSSCESLPSDWNQKFIKPLTGVRNFPDTKTDYGRGFKNGCRQSWTTVSKGLVEEIDEPLDPHQLVHNPKYAKGWWDGYEQCTYILDHDVI